MHHHGHIQAYIPTYRQIDTLHFNKRKKHFPPHFIWEHNNAALKSQMMALKVKQRATFVGLYKYSFNDSILRA